MNLYKDTKLYQGVRMVSPFTHKNKTLLLLQIQLFGFLSPYGFLFRYSCHLLMV